MTSPRFDSPLMTVVNIVGIALWPVVVVVVIRDWRRGERPSTGDWLAIGVNLSVAGVYLPVGPLLWIAAHGRSAARAPDSLAAREPTDARVDIGEVGSRASGDWAR